MQITKYIHSCLLVRENGKTILIDPGIFTYQAKALDLDTLPGLDYILVTHEHADHLYVPFVKELAAKFPEVKIISNQGVADLLKKDNITVGTEGNDIITMEPVPHEKIFPGMDLPQNTMITIFGRLSDPGDSLHFGKSAEVLALPVQAPWGSTVWAVEKALAVKPKVVIPIHDWHWSEEGRKWSYEMIEKVLGKKGIRLIKMETGKMEEV